MTFIRLFPGSHPDVAPRVFRTHGVRGVLNQSCALSWHHNEERRVLAWHKGIYSMATFEFVRAGRASDWGCSADDGHSAVGGAGTILDVDSAFL